MASLSLASKIEYDNGKNFNKTGEFAISCIDINPVLY
jgi:hypothetical protein